MSLRLKSSFQGITNATGTDWDDVFDSVPMLKSETADGATAVAAYIDTSSAWSNAASKLYSWRNNGVEKAYVKFDGTIVATAFSGSGASITANTEPLASLVNASAASKLIGRGGSSGAGAFQEISIGAGLSFTGTTLDTAGGGGGTPGGSSGDYQINTAGAFAGGSWKEAAANRVGLGGTTSSFPAWKRSGAGFIARLADDSADATVQGSVFLAGAGSLSAPCFALAAEPSTGFFAGGYGISVSHAGNLFANMSVNGLGLLSSRKIYWDADPIGSAGDLAIFRNAAGVLEINNGTSGTYRDLRLRNLLDTNGVQVVTTQGAAVADSTGVLLDLTTQFNSLLARVRAHGLIAT